MASPSPPPSGSPDLEASLSPLPSFFRGFAASFSLPLSGFRGFPASSGSCAGGCCTRCRSLLALRLVAGGASSSSLALATARSQGGRAWLGTETRMRSAIPGTARETCRSSQPQTSHHTGSAWILTGPSTCRTGSRQPSEPGAGSRSGTDRSSAFSGGARQGCEEGSEMESGEPTSSSPSSPAASGGLRQRNRPSTYLPKRATMKSGVRWPSTRNCCRAALRSLAVGSVERMRVTSARSWPLKPKRCRKSSRRRMTSREACRESGSPWPERCSEARRHSQRRCASSVS
mmetsp:Transcript_34663/g.107869  ORF Transcript_34663/g.107869 Transcript_34663/m.107869 type:complete len:288 (-) Transcript_34663:759-1622(-)